MERTHLSVPPEEASAAQTAGAHWDDCLKCWYILAGEDRTRFARWLDVPDGDFTITSERAFVAATIVQCTGCGKAIEVLCIYCESGTASGEPLRRFTVTDVLAVDEPMHFQQGWADPLLPTLRLRRAVSSFYPPSE